MIKTLCGIVFIMLLFLSSSLMAEDINQIEKLIDEGWWADAHSGLMEYLNANPDDPKANFFMGKTCFLIEDWESAEDYLDKAIKLDDSNSRYHYWLGNTKGMRAQQGGVLKAPGRAKACKREYERALELKPENIDARFGLMQYYMQAPGLFGGDKDEARLQADTIAYYDTLKGYLARATIFEHIDEDYPKTEKEYTEAIARDTLNLAPYFWYGRFLAGRDRYDEAESLAYRGLAIDSSEVNIYYSLADIYVHQERYGEALRCYEQILTLDSTDLLAVYQTAKTLLMAETDLNRGEAFFKKYLNSKLKGYWPDKAGAHWRLAMVYNKQGRYEQARDELETGLALKPKNTENEMKELLKQVKKKLK
jgi:tetratricopeptide (TPR) repeat protein